MNHFRFEKLEVWKDAMALGNDIYKIAEEAEKLRKYRFAEQLYAAVMSISNNIAEGSGAPSNKEFARYLAIARSSIFEVVNILFVFEKQGIIPEQKRDELYSKLLILSKKLSAFRKSLLNP